MNTEAKQHFFGYKMNLLKVPVIVGDEKEIIESIKSPLIHYVLLDCHINMVQASRPMNGK